MSKKTEKTAKDPKGSAACVHYPYAFVRDLEALKEFRTSTSNGGETTYQLFLRVKDDEALPEVVARPSGKESYPVDHVKMRGLTVTSLDGWDVAKAICDAVEGSSVRKDEIGKYVLDAYNMLHDVCTLNDSLSSKSAVELVAGAKRIMEQIAERLHVPLDC